MNSSSPPRFPMRLFKMLCKPVYHADIEGDLLEIYERRVKDLGRPKAKWLLIRDVLFLLRPGLLRSFSTSTNINYMFRHNLLIAARSFMRYKTSFIVNVTGLSTGLACVLLIFLWVSDELRMDQFHVHGDRLYQVVENVEQGGRTITRVTTAGPTADALAKELPEVELAVTSTFERIQNKVLSFETNNIKAKELFAGPAFFQMFSFQLIEGDPQQVLEDKKSIVISKSLALRLFGTAENARGKNVEVDHSKQFQVSGIMEDLPVRSSVQFDYVLPFDVFLDDNEGARSWFNTGPQTHVLLKAGAQFEEVNRKIADFVRVKTEGQASHRSPFLRLYSKAYLYNRYEDGHLVGGRIEYVRLFSIIAGFIALIACINFMNLSTARASRRVKEVGIKKAVGARQRALIFQYLSESTLLALLSLGAAVTLVWLLLPNFNVITAKHLSLTVDQSFVIALFCMVIITGIVAGSYPALYLSKFNPALVLKGKLSGMIGEGWARKGLVVFQFTLSIIMIVCVVVVYKQIEFIQTKSLGYDKANILIIGREGAVIQKQQTFLEEVRRIPGVIASSSSGHDMTGHNGGTYGVEWPGKNPEDRTEFERITSNYGLIELLGVEMKEGRSFSESGGDLDKIIFNEAAIHYMEMKDPLGKVVNFNGPKEIIGVVKDFHFETFREQVKPAFFFLNPRATGNIMVKVEAAEQSETISRLEKFYNNFNPGFPFTYRFIDDDYQDLYAAENRISTLSKYFAGLAIIISCLGLFGLAAFTAERRVKEIGIRKVLGSGNTAIVYMLSEEFTKMVIVAIVIALPISWFMASLWLEGFAFRISLEWWFFVLSGFAALMIAWLTVAIQTMKAARISPVDCLRNE